MNQERSTLCHLVTGARLFDVGRFSFVDADPLKVSRRGVSGAGSMSLLDRIGEWLRGREDSERDAYLSKSHDVFDLEQRMRNWDRGAVRRFL